MLTVAFLIAAAAGTTSIAGQRCGGTPILQVSLAHSRGSFNVLADPTDGGLFLKGEENGRGGWLIAVYKEGSAENLLPNESFSVGPKIDIDAMNWPYYPKPSIILPVAGTSGKCLCIRFRNIRVRGSGAAASFAPGSSVEFRILKCAA